MTRFDEIIRSLEVGMCRTEEKRAECSVCQHALEQIAFLERLPGVLKDARDLLAEHPFEYCRQTNIDEIDAILKGSD